MRVIRTRTMPTSSVYDGRYDVDQTIDIVEVNDATVARALSASFRLEMSDMRKVFRALGIAPPYPSVSVRIEE